MNLEDHIGDIIRKARAMSGVAASAAASAAQISETQLSDLEETGKTGAKINFSELGKILALHPNKLEAIANGLSDRYLILDDAARNPRLQFVR